MEVFWVNSVLIYTTALTEFSAASDKSTYFEDLAVLWALAENEKQKNVKTVINSTFLKIIFSISIDFINLKREVNGIMKKKLQGRQR
ncbi:MAG: hypothetical protein MJZ39_01200 [Bacteroidales bacterium]|nr:hypothetical protein [Bacteroidales bacterium]